MPYFFMTLLVILADQATKLIVQTRLYPSQSMSYLKNIFAITYVRNYGAAFGVLQSQTWLLICLSVGVVVFIWLNRHKLNGYSRAFQIGLAVALGGTLGNLIDRIHLGYVVDFLDFYIWPVFNIADMAIVGGVGLIIFGLCPPKNRTPDLSKSDINGSSDISCGSVGKEDF